MAVESEALDIALRMAKQPVMVRDIRRAPLPGGVLHVLELAVGDTHALQDTSERKNISDQELRAAAEFFVEQILFYHRSNSYRILGVEPNVSDAEIRRHMALIMKWVHPDLSASPDAEAATDRTMFANRATQAWEDLKSKKRRRHYNQTIGFAGNTAIGDGRARQHQERYGSLRPPEGATVTRPLRMVRYEKQRPSSFARIIRFLIERK